MRHSVPHRMDTTQGGGAAMSGPFNAGEAAQASGVTVVEGSTFCLSTGAGYIAAGAAHGLFLQDARVLSQWELRLDGQPAAALSVEQPEAFAARFVARRAPGLLLTRDRL